MSVHQYTGAAPAAAIAIQPPSWWAGRASLTSDLNTYGQFVTANSYDHYTLGLGIKGCAALGEAINSTAWLDRAIYYVTGIMALATTQAGGYLGWKSEQDGNREVPLREIYCWRFVTDLLRSLSARSDYAAVFDEITAFLEHNIWEKWISRNGPAQHAVVHIGTHWCKIALYLKDHGTTPAIRASAQSWLDTLDHIGFVTWGNKSIRSQLRPHPADSSAWFWPSEFDDGDIATGSDTSHGEALYTYVADCIRYGYGPWSMADVPKFLALKSIFWDTAAGKNWNYLIGAPGVATWSGKYTEVGNMAQFDRAFQVQFEGLTVAQNTELFGTGALNALRLGPPYK